MPVPVTNFYLSYSSIAVKKHNSQGNFPKDAFNWGLAHRFRGLAYEHLGREHKSSQAWHWISFWELTSYPPVVDRQGAEDWARHSSDTLSKTRPHLLIFPYQCTNWVPNIQVRKSMEATLFQTIVWNVCLCVCVCVCVYVCVHFKNEGIMNI